MTKIAIVISRYGREINGGAELHARDLAEHLNKIYDVTVLTTSENDESRVNGSFYPIGEDMINDVRILRFETEQKDKTKEGELLHYLYKNSIYKRARFKPSNFLKLLTKKIKYRDKKNINEMFNDWIELQGAYSPSLTAYIKKNKDNYDIFIFLLYHQYTTYSCISEVSRKSILIPIAHEDPSLDLISFDKVFSSASYIMYNSISEKGWVESLHPLTKSIKSDIAGIGRDKPNLTKLESSDHSNIDINNPYFVYIGRIHESKGCDMMINYFKEYKKNCKTNSKLILIGKNFMGEEDSSSKDIIYTGFISEDEKLFYLQNAIALIIPSPYESLSAVTLEAMVMGKPVLANGKCEVLKNHIEQSNAGYIFYNKDEFSDSLNKFLNMPEEEKLLMANNGISYIQTNYDWKAIINKFSRVINEISNESLIY